MNGVTPRELVDMEGLTRAAECLKTLAHPHRLHMVQLLLKQEHTVGELAEACGIPSHMASEHLRLMKDRGLLNFERRGRRIYYRAATPGLESIMTCVQCHYGDPDSDSE